MPPSYAVHGLGACHSPDCPWCQLALPDPGDLASKAVRLGINFLKDPENLAGLSGELLLPLVVFRGRRVPFIPFLIVALMGYAGGRMGYRSYKNLETLARSVTPMVVTDDA